MKVLIVNSSDSHGGAARAAYRLHQALLDQDIEVQMLVLDRSSDEQSVLALETKVQKYCPTIRTIRDIIPVKFYPKRGSGLFSSSIVSSSALTRKINEIDPDIVHLHWICSGMIKIEELAKIKAPIVWSLHDMWAFTGGCHYDEECGAYKERCGRCPVLGSEKENDLSRKVFLRKQRNFANIENMTIVGLSHWIQERAKESTLLKGQSVISLPNPIECDRFAPFDKVEARALWGLPQDKRLVLFGAMGTGSDPRKGFEALREALHRLDTKEIEFVVFGSSEPEKSQDFGAKTHYFGSLSDDVSLVTLYSAVDVTIVPSLQENLSNVIMESLACATPVVGFAIGGNSDMVEHKENGYLVKPFDTADLANGIEWVLENEAYDGLCQKAREKVLKEFDAPIVAQRYLELYKEVSDA